MKSKTRRIKLECNIFALATELGIERQTLQRRANRANVSLDGEFINLRDLVKLMSGDKEAEMVAKIRSERELNEIEIAEKKGVLVPRAALEADLWNLILKPFRDDFLALAKRLNIESEVEALMAKHYKRKV
ncbi:MAG TPA: hypothetical protein VMF08_10425 [Candidatus Sulfotelmatobacter sp.]|nr:hypothetical protein [Candidatus Sulfotelmatobacter sp.]